jgi:hypothetical protein
MRVPHQKRFKKKKILRVSCFFCFPLFSTSPFCFPSFSLRVFFFFKFLATDFSSTSPHTFLLPAKAKKLIVRLSRTTSHLLDKDVLYGNNAHTHKKTTTTTNKNTQDTDDSLSVESHHQFLAF